jgi:hypothetical protein
MLLNTTGGNNVAIGTQALRANNASNNTAVGDQAGYAITTGANNVAVGYQAMQAGISATAGAFVVGTNYTIATIGTTDFTLIGASANTVGVTFTATGVGTGTGTATTNTTGSGNTAVGYRAAYSQTVGSRVTAVGIHAAFSNTTDDTTAIGYQALYANTTGAYNTAVGRSAAVSTTTGGQNIAMGFEALAGNTTGNNNVALGMSALKTNTTSNNITAVGYNAGNLVTGIGNQFFGNNSGCLVTTGAKNVILGSYTGSAAPISATGSNFVVLSDGDGVVRQTIDSSGNVGIGTSSPAYKLHVVSTVTTTAGFKNSTAVNTQIIVGNTAGDSAIRTLSTGDSLIFSDTGKYLGFGTNGGTERMRLDASGNLGLGVTPSAWGSDWPAFQVGRAVMHTNTSDGRASFGVNYYVDGANARYIASAAASQLMQVSGEYRFFIAPSGTAGNAITFTQAMTLDASGNLLVGTTALTATPISGHVLALAATAAYHAIGHATGTPTGDYYATFSYNGTLIGSITQSGTTAVLYNVTSDQRLKENIQDAAPASALIDAIQVRQFDWKSDGSHQRYGFIAQELVTVAPEAVHQPADPEEMMAVDYSKLVPMLVKEIQDLRKRLAAAGIA